MKTLFLALALCVAASVFAFTPLTGGGLLVNGNMESATGWTVTNLHGGAPNPVLTWNETTYTPTYGQGGCLRITSAGNADPSSTVAIYQAVTLEAGKLYTFNGAFIDNAGGLKQAGIQVYLGQTQPSATDYTEGWLCEYNSWVPAADPADKDNTFEMGASGSRKILCTTSGTYYLVVKVGLWGAFTMDISLDELSLTESTVVALTGGGLLGNGNMETKGAWTETNLDANPAPVTTWGYTAEAPQYGSAGCFRVVGTKPTTGFTNACIYQKVALEADKTYEYDLAFKDITEESKEAWVEVYLSASEPVTSVDFTDGKIGLLSSWNPAATPLHKDITFQSAAGDVKNFVCPETNDYYFVIKTGSNFSFDFLFDEVLFREKGTGLGVVSPKMDKYRIIVNEGVLKVDGVVSNVELFDTCGRNLQTAKLKGTFLSKHLKSGVYIVRIDGSTSKITVK
ncbi:MAG: T9SS type A sorting domain-containing protein [Bacteroidales bacterium]|nr:T9SS type A sorting domain-containing protein [Bacteroidales bacterium]